MRWRRALAIVLWFLGVLCALALMGAAYLVRSPALVMWRPLPFVAFVMAILVFCGLAWMASRRRRAWTRWLLIAPAVLALSLCLWREASLIQLKASVLNAPQDELRAAARHLVVGFGAFEDLDILVTRAGVAGVFVGSRNARGAGEAQLARETGRLQALRRASQLPPLVVATEQEGGIVSALSPPLRQPPALATLTHEGGLIVNAAEESARDLACVGVNVNFAPVVDLGRRGAVPRDIPGQISRRAISFDERVVAQAARDYCRAMGEAGVQCTLKHFPGLGAASGDTHVQSVTLSELREEDLFPFREIAQDEPPWIMLGHVDVDSLDPGHPVSASRKAIDILRRDWAFDGVLITDDASMAAYARDFDRNVVASLAGGADLLLVSYDSDLVYAALDVLLRARRDNPELRAAMTQSEARLAKHSPPETLCRRLAMRG